MLKVLVADDNTAFLNSMKDIMELKGYQVFTAVDGAEAVKKTERKQPDLIIMDIKMPGMDGIAAYDKIKEIAPQTPVILVTAFAGDDVIEGALRKGVYSCLRKPIDFDDLFGIIDNATSGGRLVLVVDDNKEFSFSLSDVLREKGYRTAVAHNGAQAIIKTQENRFDVILLDMNLPYFNGLEAYREIRNIRPDAVVIIITGYGAEAADMARTAVEQSAYTWMEKPVDFGRLLALLERINEQKARGKLEKPGESRSTL